MWHEEKTEKMSEVIEGQKKFKRKIGKTIQKIRKVTTFERNMSTFFLKKKNKENFEIEENSLPQVKDLRKLFN